MARDDASGTGPGRAEAAVVVRSTAAASGRGLQNAAGTEAGDLEMKPTLALLFSALLAVSIASRASAQLVAAKNGPIVYGHHHLNTTNVDAQKKFFVDTLGGTLIKIGTNNAEIIKFPNVLIFFRTNQPPTGGTRGTTVNHIGFSVPNLRQAVDKIKANGFQMITKTEATPDRVVTDDIAGPAQPGGASIAFALAPDDVKVELVENKQQAIPITLHHGHFFNPRNTDMQEIGRAHV